MASCPLVVSVYVSTTRLFYEIFAMRFRTLFAIAVVVFAAPLPTKSDEHTDSKDAGFFAPSEIKWQEGPRSIPPGAKLAVLDGDPSKEGPFVMRLRLPDGYSIPPHTHPKTERLTVITGTFNIAMGETPDKKSARKRHERPAIVFHRRSVFFLDG